MRALALAAVLGLAPVAAGAGTGLCLVPLEGGGPASGIEREQPWRIIGQSAALPGVPWVLVAPTNRGTDFYTVDGNRFERVDAEFPRGALWIVTITPPRADGSVYGWITPAYRPYRLYRLAPGAEAFEPVSGTDAARRFDYDPAEGRLSMQGADGRLYDVAADGIHPSPLGGLAPAVDPLRAPATHDYSKAATLPRFVPPLGVHIAAMEETGQIWLRTAVGAWRLLEQGGPIHQAWRVTDGRWHHDAAEGIVTLQIGSEVLVLDARSPGDTRMLYRVTTLGGGVFQPGGPALVWEAARRGALARLLGITPPAPLLRRVTRDGLATVPGAEVAGWYAVAPRGQSPGVPGHGVQDLPEFGAWLITHAEGRSVWRDGRIEPAPQLSREAVGEALFVHRFGGRVFLVSLAGFFELNPDMTVTPLAWPVPGETGWDVIEAPALGGALVHARHLGQVWFTSDGRRFVAVENRTGGARAAFGAALPGRAALLAATETGAALVEACR